MTIKQFSEKYIDNIRMSRTENTARAYKNAINLFFLVLNERWIDPDTELATNLTEDAIAWFATYLKNFAPATERLYLQAVKGFYEYLAAEKVNTINLPRLKLLLRQRSRRIGQRLPQFPREEIEKVLAYVEIRSQVSNNLPADKLRALRDRAFIITLADTGLRVSEACRLRRGDIDWNEGRAIIIGKGDKQAIIRFSSRSMKAIKEYLNLRMKIDGSSGLPLPSLALFSRHDKGAGRKTKPITTTTGRNIVAENVRSALGDDAERTITPHSFRHYFVTTVLRASGNLKLAQELARHTNISVTQRYAHLSDNELDQGYAEIFDNE
ncbi:MAG: tyrosine-type recombinase/integrase [Chloroflexota bacterium]